MSCPHLRGWRVFADRGIDGARGCGRCGEALKPNPPGPEPLPWDADD